MSGSSSTALCARNAHITLYDVTPWSWVNLVNPPDRAAGPVPAPMVIPLDELLILSSLDDRKLYLLSPEARCQKCCLYIPRGPPRRVSAYEISKSTGFHVDFGFQIGFLDFTWISGFQSGFLDFKVDFWISRGFLDFKVDFWISKWISGFHVDFRISKWISTFRILFEELLFVILKILLINKPSQPGCTQNTMSQALHSSPRRTAYCVHNV